MANWTLLLADSLIYSYINKENYSTCPAKILQITQFKLRIIIFTF